MSLLNALSFAFKRLGNHLGLAACLAGGLVAAVALAVAVPLYADGVNYNLLNAALAKQAAGSRRPPFSFVFHYVGSWHEPIPADRYAPVDAFLGEQAAGVIGLPALGVTRYVSTDNLQLYPAGEKIVRSKRLDLVRLAFLSGVFDHVRLVEGAFPSPGGRGDGGEGEVIDVLISLSLANDLGLQAGETYQLYQPASAGGAPYQQPVRIAGIWISSHPDDDFWVFYAPQAFDKKLLVPEQTFFGPVAASLPLPVNEAAWRIACDGSGVHSEDVPGLLRRIDQAQIRANALLPHTDLESSPVQALRQYRRDALALTGALFAFSAPVLGLALLFLELVASMLVRRQRNEIAVLRSRGGSRGWVAAVYLLEWALLGGVALAAGPGLAMGVARLVGQTQSFLDFSRLSGNGGSAAFPLRLTASALGTGGAAAGLAVLFCLLPAWQAGGDTIVSYKQERARALRRPLWQRMYLDALLLLPALYGLYTLRAQGRLELFGRAFGSANPFENPLLFLLPTLFMIALSLLLLRLLPRLLSSLAWLAEQLPGPAPALALRQLAHSASSGAAAYLGLVLLMAVTLGLAGFTASMAHTLDRALADSAYYEVGADLNLAEGGEYTGEAPASLGSFAQPGAASGGNAAGREASGLWNFLPVSDHLSLPGVLAAARVGRYDAELTAGGRSAGGRLVGIDRAEFPAVAFFRPDLNPEPLNGLMNRLASDPAALLVDRATWERFHLNTGDLVELRVSAGSETRATTFKIAGLLDYFPALYPEDGPFFVANLEYLFEAWGGLQPYDVWLRTAPGADVNAIVAGINRLGVAVITVQDARSRLDVAYAAPSRQGMLGLLSVGFLAASVLTVIGFFLHTLFSFQERFIQFGVLRAIGLSTKQMAAALALEQVLLILTGLAAGTGVAVLAAVLFIPHLPPIAAGAHPGTPPVVVAIAWEDILRVYIVFAAMLLASILATLALLARMKIFQAVKLGETV